MAKKKIVIFIVILAVALSGLLAAMFFWASQPVKTDVKINNGPSLSTITESATPIDTAYFSTELPVGYKIKTSTDSSVGPQLIQILAPYSKGDGQIAITIGALPKSGINDVADYNYRLKNPDLYIHTQFGGMPSEATAFFSQKGDNEVAVFWPHSGLYGSISVSGSIDRRESLNSDLTNILDKWHWK